MTPRAERRDLTRSALEDGTVPTAGLEDGAVPTAGLDERGVLTLSCGELTYTARIGLDLRVVLRDAQGRIARSVQLRRHVAAPARKALAALHRQLRKLVEKQSRRLHNAMLTGRVWRPDELRDHLLRHPVVGTMCQRLIFAGLDADGKSILTFRPTEDGSCIGAANDVVNLDDCAGVCVTHRVFLESPEVRAWRQHFEDYRLVPLFAQMN
jgi:hypothetical protein